MNRVRYALAVLPIASLSLQACEQGPKGPGEAEFETASNEAKSVTTLGSGNTEGCKERAVLASKVVTMLRAEMFSDNNGQPFRVHCHESEHGMAFLMYVPELKHFKDVRGDLADLGWQTVQLVTQDLQGDGALKLGLGMRGEIFYGVVGIADAGSTPTFDLAKVAKDEPLHAFFAAKAVESRPLPEGAAEETMALVVSAANE